MREFTFNDACGERAFSSQSQAISSVAEISIGVAELVAAGLAQKVLRLTDPPTSVLLADGLSLFDAMLQISRDQNTRDQGVFLQSLTQKVPLDERLEADAYERIVEWDLRDFPGKLGLLLCACSDRIAVSATEDGYWHASFIDLPIVGQSCGGDGVENIFRVPNVFSSNVEEIRRSVAEEGLDEKTVGELWECRGEAFQNLIFAPSVLKNLSDLGDLQFRAAITKLRQIDASAKNWNGRPEYTLEVRGESERTMNKYGKLRKFIGFDGETHTFELHVTVTDGFRMHFREIQDDEKIEIGYVGPHLKVAKRN